jgi:superfamily II DNA or RNA helicase
MTLENGQLVEHVTDVAFGQGKVSSVDTIAGVRRVGVRWANRTGIQEHTEDQLRRVLPLPDRLEKLGPASLKTFQLKVLGRWFEARHSLTGELANQPFQMLPHQVIVANTVVNGPVIQAPEYAKGSRAWLIADDVGLGKTIEAGMIIEVMRRRSVGTFRCLVVTPAGLRDQWVDELKNRFGRRYRKFESNNVNELEDASQLVASIDTLKLAKFKKALEAITPWDLIVFDEAHHLATMPSVQSYQLAHLLRVSGKAKNMLFLTATPHSGNNEHFYNMLRILREDLFPKGAKDYPEVPLKPVMIRNRKSDVTDTKGQKIFKGIAKTDIIPFPPTPEEIKFFEELQEYLKNGYKTAERLESSKGGTGKAVGFLMSTFSKLASSSRAAIETALKNRKGVLRGLVEIPEDGEENEEADARHAGERAEHAVAGAALKKASAKKKRESLIDNEEVLVDELLTRLGALRPGDTKLKTFLKHVGKLAPDLKLLIFTEYRATQQALAEALTQAFGKHSVGMIHGSMKNEERRRQVDLFNEDSESADGPYPRFMVSTEAGGEGLNMQRACHTVVNYDLPWNPMALQQRIGRVYRYGQTKPVVVWNLKVESDSTAFADQRVYSYLERKIEEITRKLAEVQDGNPEDIRGEVLGEIAATINLDELYKTAVAAGEEKAIATIDSKADHFEKICSNPERLDIFRGLARFDLTDYEKVKARVTAEQLKFFVVQYLARFRAEVRTSSNGLMSFTPPKELIAVANALEKADAGEARDKVTATPVQRATVDKEVAQKEGGSRLLRFGDAAFEAMVRHVQHGGFAEGVATLELPAAALGWRPGDQGTWVLFDLRIVRQEGSNAIVVRNELASFVVPKGGVASLREDVVESLHLGIDGPFPIDQAEARRAYEVVRKKADERLAQLHGEAVEKHGSGEGLLPDAPHDVAVAWVKAGG